jgi:hypothetical protein
MKVIIKKVGKQPEVVDIENTLDAMQKIVGGYIEAVRVRSDCMMICNEEGKLMGLPYNFDLGNDKIVGDVIFTKPDGAEFTDLDDRNVEMILHFFDRTPYTT